MYSLAICLAESGINLKNISIDGIDISAKSIEVSRQALYNDASLKETEPELKAKYFQEAEDVFILHPRIAQQVNFYKANFIEADFFLSGKKYDIIVAANVFDALTDDARFKLLANIQTALKDSGLLITTDSEIKFIPAGQFKKTESKSVFFMKIIKEKANIEDLPLQRIKKSHSLKILPKILKHNKKTEKVFEINQDNAKYQTNRIKEIRSNVLSGKLDIALKICFEQLSNDNQNPDLYYWMGNIYEQKNKIDKAVDFYHKALYLEPYHYDTIVKLIILFENKGWADKSLLLKKRLDKLTGMQ